MIKSQKNYKSNAGITLVALVVTIIVLLILAGVTLSLVMGNEGILQRATNARTEHEEASEEERRELDRANLSAEYYHKKYVEKATGLPDTVEEYVEANMPDEEEGT